MKETSPKYLQRSGKFEEALKYYKKRYYEVIEKQDRYLSTVYLDEIAQTIILMKKENVSSATLREEIYKVIMPSSVEEKGGNEFKELEEDLEIILNNYRIRKERT